MPDALISNLARALRRLRGQGDREGAAVLLVGVTVEQHAAEEQAEGDHTVSHIQWTKRGQRPGRDCGQPGGKPAWATV